MSVRILLAVMASLAMAAAAHAGIVIDDAYARTASPMARSGAVFMTIRNDGKADDRLTAARSDAAAKVGLHTHLDMGNGVMNMIAAENGFVVPAGGHHELARGGDHIMFMGLTGHWADGDRVHLVLTFETAGEIEIDVPVDQTHP